MTPTRQPEEIVDLAHPFGVALGEVVVHRHHVHAAPGERVEIDRQRRHQRLAFAGLHFGNASLVQDHAADELHVEVPLTERALGRLRGRWQMPRPECHRGSRRPPTCCLNASVRARRASSESSLKVALQRVDRRNPRKIGLDPPLVRRTEQLAGNSADHAVSPSRPRRCCCRTLPNPTGRNATAGDGFRRNSACLQASMAVECGKCRTFRSSFMQTAAACGWIGQFVER